MFYFLTRFHSLVLSYLLIGLIVSMLLFPSTFYYVSCLLLFSLFFIFYLRLVSSISVLTFLIVSVVYVGAIIVLIGYICAISPNPQILYSRYSLPFVLVVFFLCSLFLLTPFFDCSALSPVIAYFYTAAGSFFLLVLLLFLFLILLIVTSYHLSSKGPLRSVYSA